MLFSLGRLIAPTHASSYTFRWVCQSPDGAEHELFPTLHGPATPSPAFGRVSYTHDGTYIRHKRLYALDVYGNE